MKVLIANRGEIAVRIMRGCREMGLATVAVYSDCDRLAPHVRYADEAVALDANEPAESYLRVDKLVAAATRTGSDAVHPGYGFLAENAPFARAVVDAGLRFIGPTADVIELMGGKTASRDTAARAGVPVVPGSDGALPDAAPDDELQAAGAAVGYPLFVKAVAGGGGKGMRLVREPDSLVHAIRGARSEATSAFGNGAVYLERCIEHGRHIEVQLLADQHGSVIPFVERECSIQRRHQKVIEETPSMAVDDATRRALADAAAALAREVEYTNAGTIEFLLDQSGAFYFLEMNTRLQVEHPVTEMVTGIDLVRWQLRVAQGEHLTIDPARALAPEGHAIECRVYAEDPDAGFMPCPGIITTHQAPAGPGIRVDAGVAAGFAVPSTTIRWCRRSSRTLGIASSRSSACSARSPSTTSAVCGRPWRCFAGSSATPISSREPSTQCFWTARWRHATGRRSSRSPTMSRRWRSWPRRYGVALGGAPGRAVAASDNTASRWKRAARFEGHSPPDVSR